MPSLSPRFQNVYGRAALALVTACVVGAGAIPAESRAQAASGVHSEEFARAQQLVARGDHAGAEARFDRILAQQPGNVDALAGRGHARAFQKKYDGAKADFRAVLARQPEHLGALIGLAHAHAWAGEHDAALAQFSRALSLAPENVDAQRGAAYAELWRGNPAGALARFEKLLAQAPHDPGAREGAAQARQALAGAPAPSSEQPRPGQPAPGAGTLKELSVWVGRSELPGGATESGLRFAEFAVWPSETLRLFARYDDGLSRDNAAIARAGQSAALKSLGGYWRWHERLGTSAEFGRRELPGPVEQDIYRVEQLFFLERGHLVKLGGWRGPRDDGVTESLWYAGLGLALTGAWRFEPTYFSSRTGVGDDRERRLLLALSVDLRNDWELGGGLVAGRARAGGLERDIEEGFLRASWRASDALRLHLLGRRESVEGADPVNVVSAGITLSWR